MPNWIHKTTLQQLNSVSEAELPELKTNYIEYPDLSAVDGVEKKYWKIDGDTVVEMTQAEKDAVDAQLIQDAEDSELNELSTGILRRFVLVLLDEINRARVADGVAQVTIDQLKQAMRNK